MQTTPRKQYPRYFKSRSEAGRYLADELESTCVGLDCIVLAVNQGGARIGRAIAERLVCDVWSVPLAPIVLPGEHQALALIDANGTITYCPQRSQHELYALKAEYSTYLEQEKIRQRSKLHRRVDGDTHREAAALRDRIVIVASDGLNDALHMQAIANFLKPHRIKKLVVAASFATLGANSAVRLLADEVICLNLLDAIISIEHYYDRYGNNQQARTRQYLRVD